MEAITYEMEVRRNPFRLCKRSLFIWFYSACHNSYAFPLSRVVGFTRILASIWGSRKLKKGPGKKLKASLSRTSCQDKEFYITELNSQFHSIYFEQCRDLYEPDVESVIQHFFPKDGVFVDVGSNWGYFTIKVASQCEDSQCFAFEPLQSAHSDVSRIARELGLSNVSTKNVGLSSRSGSIEIWQDGFETGQAHFGQTESAPEPSYRDRLKRLLYTICAVEPQKHVVEISTLDDQSLSKCDLIKIDVEGHELDVLEGARNTILKCSPLIIFEHWHTYDTYKRVKRFFDEYEYRILRVLVESVGATEDCVKVKLSLSEPELLDGTQYNLLAVPPSTYPSLR
jgi:FkbM family methyltransferase